MKYIIKQSDTALPLLQRLFAIRNIEDTLEDFLKPNFTRYRHDPFLLHDMSKTIDFLTQAMKDQRKIMIFSDYDVDGVSSSFLLYYTMTNFFNYPHISVTFPDRMKDGYGMKCHHLDEIKSKNVDIVITVDNGITSIDEAKYAKKLGITLIITDHHEIAKTIPDAFAVINPKISPNYPFPSLCGAGVALKLIAAMLEKSNFDDTKKQTIFQTLLPNTAIATIADIVPLIDENRLIVQQGLAQMNKRHRLPPSLSGFLDFCKIKKVDTFQVGFMIGPRINAAGRMSSPIESFYALLTTGDRQISHLQKLDKYNANRKKLQEKAIKEAETSIDLNQKILIAYHPDFHEGVVGIVAGRLTEKYNKPSVILTRKEDGNITGSLRGPAYFSVIDMLHHIDKDLIGCGGHKQAGGMTFAPEMKEKIWKKIEQYGHQHITDDMLEKEITIDTILDPDEWNNEILNHITLLGPYGEGNPEPVFLFKNIHIIDIKKIGKNGNGHLKLHTQYGDHTIDVLFRRKGAQLEAFQTYKGMTVNLYGKIQEDSFNGGYMIEGINIE